MQRSSDYQCIRLIILSVLLGFPMTILIAILIICTFSLPASWLSGNAFVPGAGVRGFKTRAGQIEHRVFLKEAVLPGPNDAEMSPANSLHASA